MMIRTLEGREVIVAMGSETLVILDQDDPTCRSFIHLDPTQALLLASELRDKAELILSEAGSAQAPVEVKACEICGSNEFAG